MEATQTVRTTTSGASIRISNGIEIELYFLFIFETKINQQLQQLYLDRELIPFLIPLLHRLNRMVCSSWNGLFTQ
jgi:hypothetical protein